MKKLDGTLRRPSFHGCIIRTGIGNGNRFCKTGSGRRVSVGSGSVASAGTFPAWVGTRRFLDVCVFRGTHGIRAEHVMVEDHGQTEYGQQADQDAGRTSAAVGVFGISRSHRYAGGGAQ